MAMAGLAAVFWGSMGVAGQYLLQNCHFTPMDLISIRMLLAGSIFVGIEFFLLKKGALKVFETKQNIINLHVNNYRNAINVLCLYSIRKRTFCRCFNCNCSIVDHDFHGGISA